MNLICRSSAVKEVYSHHVHFKNRYMVVEVFIDPARGEQDPVILTQFNITKVIRDSIQLNFGECGLAGSLGSLQGTTSNYF